MFCPKCGHDNRDDAKFCASCGEDLAGRASQSEEAADQAQPVQAQEIQAQPVQPAQPDFNYAPQPSAPKGCFAQAFSDVMGNLSVLAKVALFPGVIALVSAILLLIPVIGPILGVCGFVCAAIADICAVGYAIQWGREAAGSFGFDPKSKPLNTPTFSLGFFGDVVASAFRFLGFVPVIIVFVVAILGMIGTASSYSYGYGYGYGGNSLNYMLYSMGGILMLAVIVSVVLCIFAEMLAQTAVLHMAICNKVDETFNIVKVWKGFREKKKLFCAAVLPGWVIGLVSGILSLIITGITGASISDLLYQSSYGYGSGPSLGTVLISFALLLFINLVAGALTNLVRNRAVAYWVARYNPGWVQRL